ncbi:MAG: zinc ribbon domain-containing protein [Candidatus Rokubacteria bacterium]|nr:zinc ribbon domain-containing protein [Candidatus Rokubacteria bacterium]
MSTGMACPECAQAAPPGAAFCSHCGTPLLVVCAQCGAQDPAHHRFCSSCGERLEAPGGARGDTAGPPRARTDRLLTSRSALEGERKQVTVLFADLKSSMDLLADLDPEDARALLDPVLELMMEAVRHHGGIVNQVLADGIMALFGAPVVHEDHAARACLAALRILEGLARHRRTQAMPIHARIGLNSGEVIVRSVGNDLHLDYAAVGQTTHLAARMQQLAPPDSAFLPAETARLVDDRVDLRSLGPRAVKGLAEPVEVFEILTRRPESQ